MNKETKKYRLLKDLPWVDAGVIYTPENEDNHYYNYNGASFLNRIFVDDIMNNPDWFEPVAEPIEQDAFVWTDALVQEFADNLPVDTMAGMVEINQFKQSKSTQQVEGTGKTKMKDVREWVKKTTPPQIEEAKDWEIMCVKSNRNADILDTVTMPFVKEYYLTEEGKKHYTIFSVRRLFDNTVFSVGDKVGYDNGNIRTKEDWAIDHFYIRESDGVLLVRSKDCSNVELVDKWLYKNSSPTPPKERISVNGVYKSTDYPNGSVKYSFDVDKEIPLGKKYLIREAIEKALNNE